jgi:hypothetical protein
LSSARLDLVLRLDATAAAAVRRFRMSGLWRAKLAFVGEEKEGL